MKDEKVEKERKRVPGWKELSEKSEGLKDEGGGVQTKRSDYDNVTFISERWLAGSV